jgi:tRNA (guanine37-N1)-methyltransferase
MRIDVLTIFPEIFTPLEASIAGRAKKSGIFTLYIHDIRDYARGPHRAVDDRPYGGGPGMVMKPGPIVRAAEDIIRKTGPCDILIMSPRGEKFSQKIAARLSRKEHLIIICGRYEGIDERVIEYLKATEISIGDYILSGGEVPAMAVIESAVRLIPGALGSEDSTACESFSEGLLEYPQYTRPEDFRGLKAPAVLLSGNHDKIKKWRKELSVKYTREKRPDLTAG